MSATLEKQLWKADTLRKNIDAAECKHVVLTKGALTSKTSGEGDVRAALVKEGNLIGCMVNLPRKLFFNTPIPAALWFLNRARNNGHPRKGEILFIDGRNLGHLINRQTRELSADDIQQISQTYHNWRTGEAGYEDLKGFCASVPLERVRYLDYVMTPGRCGGMAVEKDDFGFAERFTALKTEFEAQLTEKAALKAAIAHKLYIDAFGEPDIATLEDGRSRLISTAAQQTQSERQSDHFSDAFL